MNTPATAYGSSEQHMLRIPIASWYGRLPYPTAAVNLRDVAHDADLQEFARVLQTLAQASRRRDRLLGLVAWLLLGMLGTFLFLIQDGHPPVRGISLEYQGQASPVPTSPKRLPALTDVFPGSTPPVPPAVLVRAAALPTSTSSTKNTATLASVPRLASPSATRPVGLPAAAGLDRSHIPSPALPVRTGYPAAPPISAAMLAIDQSSVPTEQASVTQDTAPAQGRASIRRTPVLALTPEGAVVYDPVTRAQRLIRLGEHFPDGQVLKRVDARTEQWWTDQGEAQLQ